NETRMTASDDSVKTDAIVVGGGPAGLSAALSMAQAGLGVILVERGEYAGAKNVGGLVYGTVLNRLIPNAFEKAPIERPVSRRSLVMLGGSEHVALDFGADEWSRPPFNHTYIVHRAQFDRWFASQADAAGASLLEGMVAEEVLMEGSNGDRRAVGVKLRGDEIIHADVIVLADGANCLVSEKARTDLGMKPGRIPQEYAVGVKEIIGLPKGTIEDRFNLEEGEGAAVDFFGVPFEGLIGGGFLYTGRDAIHLGFAARIESLTHAGISPNDILTRLKQHPLVRKYIRGGELLEYSAHMIPEGGYRAIPELAGNGVLIAGDAAGLVNMSLYKEGTNHAMESGAAAGETIAELKAKGDWSAKALQRYTERLCGGVAFQDLKRYSRVPDVLTRSPNLLSLYPKKVNRMLIDYFTCLPEPKKATQRRALRNFLSGLPKFQFVRDLIRARHLA
ncbi:MAG: FAD-dependent oxidoreductase, partial [Kiritimatiellia bacterium]|nr:FAD-dependent oxidoreductase [Kiritimatiellia bacterium]